MSMRCGWAYLSLVRSHRLVPQRLHLPTRTGDELEWQYDRSRHMFSSVSHRLTSALP